jgi:amidophosphoribosyltransferase
MQADEVVYQSLDDLKAACLEAADEDSEVKDFEVGVFCGKYKTEVPPDYFEQPRSKKSKTTATTDKVTLVASSGAMNVAAPRESVNGTKDLEHREDVRYVTGSDSL